MTQGAAGQARRHLLSIADLSDHQLHRLVTRSNEFAGGRSDDRPLRDRIVGVYFRKTSTRTRTAFSVGALRLGADVISYGPGDLQENTGETASDTGRVLSTMLDGFVARTVGEPAELRAMAAQNVMSVINAMSRDEHPTQAIADLSTMLEIFGRLEGVRVLYLGEGNNTAAALALALARYRGAEMHLRTPPGFGLAEDKLEQATALADARGAVVSERHDLDGLAGAFDVVYTTRWLTTGTVEREEGWRDQFRPFRVDRDLMARFAGSVFMHDLPAHRGEEVDAEVLDGARSVAFRQAAHKLYSAMAVLEWCVG